MFLHLLVKLPMPLTQPYLLLYRLSKLTFLNQLLMDFIFFSNCNSTTVERKIIYCLVSGGEIFSGNP